MESKTHGARVGENIEITTDFADAGWRDYISGAPDATPAHLLEWRDVIQNTFGYKPVYLAAKKNDRICGVLPAFGVKSLFLGRHFISVPFLNAGGICADDEDSQTALLDAAGLLLHDTGARHFEMRCTYPPRSGIPALEHKVRLVVDLPETPDELWSSLRSEIRNRTKVAQKAGLVVEFGSHNPDQFYRVFAENMHELGVPAHPKRFFEIVMKAFPDAVELAVVKDGVEAIGGAILFYYRDTVEVPWISCSRAHFRSCPNNILYWEIMRRACERGIKEFDFGRSSVGTGPATFKLRWGARPLQLYWQYILNGGIKCPGEVGTGSPRYKLASRVWSKLPRKMTDLLGPKIIAHLPG